MPDEKMGKKDNTLVIIAVLVVAAFATGIVKLPAGTESVLGETTTTTIQHFIATDDTSTLQDRVRNTDNASLQYLAANVSYTNSARSVLGNLTATASSTGTYASASGALVNGETYNFYVYDNKNDVTGCSKTGVQITSPITYVSIECPATTQPEFMQLSTAYVNLTAGSTNFSQDSNSTSATALGSGGTTSFILRYRTNESSAQFGSPELPTYVCADFDTSKFSKTEGVTATGAGWTRTDALPKYCSDNGYDIAWIIPALKSSDGEIDAKIAVKADLGDPTTGIKFMFVDSAYYLDKNGVIQSGTSDDAGTDIGATNRYSKFELS